MRMIWPVVIAAFAECAFPLEDLLAAVREGRSKKVKRLLKNKNVDVNQRNEEGTTFLYEALINGHTKIADMLMKKNANVDAFQSDGKRPLHAAVMRNDIHAVKSLLQRNASVFVVDYDLNTPLHIAAQYGNKSLVDLLLTKNPPMNTINMFGATPLHVAVHDHPNPNDEVISIVRDFIERGALINAVTHSGLTPLHYAAKNPDGVFLHLLLNEGARVDIRREDGGYPIHMAAKYGSVENILTLITNGAHANCRDFQRNTPLHFAAMRQEGARPVIQCLISKGASVHARNKHGNTPLQRVLDRHYPESETVITLIEYGAEITPEALKTAERIFWRAKWTTPESHYADFDDLLMKKMGSLLTTKIHQIHDSVPRKLQAAVEAYIESGSFALYRVLRERFKKLYVKKPSVLEERKFAITDETVHRLTGRTYLSYIPVDLITDTLLYAGYYAWEIKRLAWNLSVASYNVGADVSDTIQLMLEFLPLPAKRIPFPHQNRVGCGLSTTLQRMLSCVARSPSRSFISILKNESRRSLQS